MVFLQPFQNKGKRFTLSGTLKSIEFLNQYPSYKKHFYSFGTQQIFWVWVSRLLLSLEFISSEALRTNGTFYILLAEQTWSTVVAPFWTRYNPLRTQSLGLVPLGSMQLSVFTANIRFSFLWIPYKSFTLKKNYSLSTGKEIFSPLIVLTFLQIAFQVPGRLCTYTAQGPFLKISNIIIQLIRQRCCFVLFSFFPC